MTGPAAAIIVTFVLAAQTASAPRIDGPAAAKITAGDVSGIARAVANDGGAPWLLTVAAPTGLAVPGYAAWSALVYLPPDVGTPQLRRGRIARVLNRTWPSSPNPSAWVVDEEWSGAWAQVAVPGRAFENVGDAGDENVPMNVAGAVTDDELVEIVRFLRSKPVLPRRQNPGVTAADTHNPAYGPITNVLRSDGTIWVHMYRGPSVSCTRDGSDVIRMERSGAGWSGTYAWSCADF